MNFHDPCSNHILKHQLKGNAILMCHPPTRPSHNLILQPRISLSVFGVKIDVFKWDLTFITGTELKMDRNEKMHASL